MINWQTKSEKPKDGEEVLIAYFTENYEVANIIQSIYFDRLTMRGWGDISDSGQLLDDKRVACWASLNYPTDFVLNHLQVNINE